MAWLYIAVFSVVVAVVLVQLFKYFVTAPELAAQEAGTKRKTSTSKKSQSNTSKPKAQKSSDSSSKQQESSSSSATQEAAVPKEKKSNPAGAVSSPAQPKVEVTKENKPAKENKVQKPKEAKSQKDKVAASDLKAGSGNESTDGGKKKEKGKKADASEKKAAKAEKKKRELATETTDEEFARQWAADYNPSSSSSNKNDAPAVTTSAPDAWRQVGSSDTQIEEYKKKLQFLENELLTSRETNKSAHEKHQEALSRATRSLQATEQQHKETIARLQRELDMVKDGGMGVNDTLSSKNYSKAERTEKPRTQLKGLIADEKEKGKEDKKKEAEDKERQEKERQDKQRDEKEKQDKENNDREREEREKQTAAFKQKVADAEAKYKQAAEQLKATEAVNNFLTATLAAESRGSASAAAPASNDQSAALNKKIEELTKKNEELAQQLSKKTEELSKKNDEFSKKSDESSKKSEELAQQLSKKNEELTQQLSKKEREAEDKIKAVTAQLKEKEAEFKVAEETHAEANSQIEKLRGQLSALEASLAKGSGNEEAIKQLQQSLAEEKEKAETAQQQFELAEAAKVSYKGKLEDALRSSFESSKNVKALEEQLASANTANKGSKALEEQLAAANAVNSELNLKHAQQLEAEQKKIKDLEASLATEKTNASTSQASIEDAKSQVADAQKSAEEANKRTQEATLRADDATRRVDEAAKTIQDLNTELANLKKKSEESDSSKVDVTAIEQKHKDELTILEAKLTEEKSARAEVVNRLEELSTRVKELEAQPQV